MKGEYFLAYQNRSGWGERVLETNVPDLVFSLRCLQVDGLGCVGAPEFDWASDDRRSHEDCNYCFFLRQSKVLDVPRSYKVNNQCPNPLEHSLKVYYKFSITHKNCSSSLDTP